MRLMRVLINQGPQHLSVFVKLAGLHGTKLFIIHAVKDQFSIVLTTHEEIADEDRIAGSDAENLLEAVEKFEFYFFLMYWILSLERHLFCLITSTRKCRSLLC